MRGFFLYYYIVENIVRYRVSQYNLHLLQIQILRHNIFRHQEERDYCDNLTDHTHQEHWRQDAHYILRGLCAGHVCGACVHGTDGETETGGRKDDGGKNLYDDITYNVDADGSENLVIRDKAAHGYTEVHVDDHQKRRQQDHDQQDPAECRQRVKVCEQLSQCRQQYGHKFSVGKQDQQGSAKNYQVNDGP